MDTFLKSLSMLPDGSKVSKVIMEGMRIGTDADNQSVVAKCGFTLQACSKSSTTRDD